MKRNASLLGLFWLLAQNPVCAATVGWIGETRNNVAFYRPDVSGPVAPTGLVGFATGFTALPFSISETGNFRIDAFAGFRAVVGLYHTHFDAARPRTNAMTFERDGIPEILLPAGRPYFILLTGEGSGDFGSYALTITGPGRIQGDDPLFYPEGIVSPLPEQPFSPVPEPAQWLLMLTALFCCGLAFRSGRRKGLSFARL